MFFCLLFFHFPPKMSSYCHIFTLTAPQKTPTSCACRVSRRPFISCAQVTTTCVPRALRGRRGNPLVAPVSHTLGMIVCTIAKCCNLRCSFEVCVFGCWCHFMGEFILKRGGKVLYFLDLSQKKVLVVLIRIYKFKYFTVKTYLKNENHCYLIYQCCLPVFFFARQSLPAMEACSHTPS